MASTILFKPNQTYFYEKNLMHFVCYNYSANIQPLIVNLYKVSLSNVKILSNRPIKENRYKRILYKVKYLYLRRLPLKTILFFSFGLQFIKKDGINEI
jgi:hypothetical protein